VIEKIMDFHVYNLFKRKIIKPILAINITNSVQHTRIRLKQSLTGLIVFSLNVFIFRLGFYDACPRLIL